MKKSIILILMAFLTQTAFAKSCNEDLALILQGMNLSKGVVNSGGDSGSLSPILKIQDHVIQRQIDGELTKAEVDQFLATSKKLDEMADNQLFGDDAVSCMDNFSAKAVQSLMGLVESMKKSKNSDEIFDNLVAGSKKNFGDNDVRARQRVCLLSGKGEKCQIFGKFISRKCN